MENEELRRRLGLDTLDSKAKVGFLEAVDLMVKFQISSLILMTCLFFYFF